MGTRYIVASVERNEVIEVVMITVLIQPAIAGRERVNKFSSNWIGTGACVLAGNAK
jgi:hypothetical protein